MLVSLLLDVLFAVVIHVAFTNSEVDKDMGQTPWWASGGNGDGGTERERRSDRRASPSAFIMGHATFWRCWTRLSFT